MVPVAHSGEGDLLGTLVLARRCLPAARANPRADRSLGRRACAARSAALSTPRSAAPSPAPRVGSDASKPPSAGHSRSELDDLSAIVHINGTTNPSDVGTKTGSSTKKALPAAEALVEHGSYIPDISDDYQKSFLCSETPGVLCGTDMLN